jgi:putative ABC transport system permease protein
MIRLYLLPGIRPTVLLRLARDGIVRHRTRSAVTIAVVALAVAAVVSTTGRTDAARRTLLARLEDPSARLIRVMDRSGQANLSPAAIARIEGLSSVAWVIGLSPAGPLARNPSTGDPREGYARDAVGSRMYWGDLDGGPLVRRTSGRAPAVGEAVVGERALGVLGLADRVGTLEDENLGALAAVGSVAAAPPVENLDAYALIRGSPTEGHVTEILVLARSSAQVEPLVAQLPGLLPNEGGRPLGLDRAAELLALRAGIAQEVGALNTAVLLGSLATSALLVAAILYGAVEQRRREFGLRRAQGATRSTVAALVVIEAGLLGLGGAVAGGTAGTLAVAMQAGFLPDPSLTVAICALVSLSSVAGSIPPAVLAALREPLYVLRSE